MLRLTVLGLLLTVPAAAADIPDMTGKWTGTSRAVVGGSGGHYGEGEEAPKFVSAELTVEWTEQDDGRLIGSITSRGHSEKKIGVISSDGSMFVTADEDGSSVGRLIDENSFELCYTQTHAENDHMVASCVVFERAED